MKNRRLSTLLILVMVSVMLFVFVACQGGEEEDEIYDTTIMLYLCGSNLESRYGSASDNLKEMMGGDIPDSTAVIVETGGSSTWRDLGIDSHSLGRYRVANDTLYLMDKVKDASMGDKETLVDFLDYGITNFPAKKTILIFWNHGGGSMYGVSFDEKHGMDGVDLEEMDYALSSATKKMGKKFEMVGFDACTMANIETADIVYKYANYMIASEESEDIGGWSYERLVANLSDRTTYNRVLEDYASKYATEDSMYTLSLIDFAKYGKVQESFHELVGRLGEVTLRDINNSARRAMAFGASSDGSNLIDIVDFAEGIGVDSMADAVAGTLTAVNGPDKVGASGLSIVAPVIITEEMPAFKQMKGNEAYKQFFIDNYATPPAETIRFADIGSDANGEVHIVLDKESLKYVQDVRYKMYRFETHSTEYVDTVYLLGYDDDVIYDGEAGFTTSFGGEWASWNGNLIKCMVNDVCDEYTLFSTPIRLNGVMGEAMFKYRIEERKFSIIGFSEFSLKEQSRIVKIKDSDEITLLCDDRTGSFETNYVDGASFTFGDSDDIEVVSMPEGYFQSYIVVTDVYGNSYRTASVVSYWDGTKMKIDYISPDIGDSED